MSMHTAAQLTALHFSHTPLVGAPGRVCQALRSIPDVNARWVVLDTSLGTYDRMSFELDLVWPRDREEVLALLEQCDVVHLHNYLHLDSEEFAPISFSALWEQGKPMVRQFHSTPELVGRFLSQPAQAALDCPIPKLVLAQFHERLYPTARLVPNIVELDLPELPADGPLRIGYAPTRFDSGRDARWDTKGYRETRRLLKHVQREAAREGIVVEVDVIELVPHAECLERKARCHLFIDELVTGSYHLNTLEALALGSVCMTWLDARTSAAVQALTGRTDFPVLNVPLEQALPVLLALCRDPALVRALGRQNREWMRAHWAPAQMAQHFVAAYRDVIAAPRNPFPTRREMDAATTWRTVGLHDHTWRARQSHWPRVMPRWALSMRSQAGRLARSLRLR